MIKEEKDTSSVIRKLESDVKNEQSQHGQELKNKNLEIGIIKEKLMQIKYKTTVDTKYSRREATSRSACILRTFKQEIKQTEDEFKKILSQHDMEVLVHQKTEDFLRKKINTLQIEKDKWDKKLEVDLANLNAEYRIMKEK